MLSTFLDKASGLLDRRFLLAWWFPALIASVALLLLGIMPHGLASAWQWWQQQDGLAQTWLLFSALLLVTLFAYLLQAFTRPLVRLYEGYWPQWLRRWCKKRVEKRWKRWSKERVEAATHDASRYAALQDRLHHEYPSQAERLLPTQLGNMLRSAEDYPVTTYGMDAVFWWPRLVSVLPEAALKGIEDALMPLLALLNLATMSGLVTVAGAIYLWRNRLGGWGGPVAMLVVGLLLARLCYLGAVAQARGYGQQIRTSIDLHRFELLKALYQSLPTTPQEERAFWGRLAAWLYNQDQGAAHGLTYVHGDRGKRESQPEEPADTTEATGCWTFVQHLWRGG